MSASSALDRASELDDRAQTRLTSPVSSGARRQRGKSQPLQPLFDGQTIGCPRCRLRTSILEIKRLPEMVAYQDETVPVYRCRNDRLPRDHPEGGCGFVFALRASPVNLPLGRP